jgi:GTP cyclohydrolase II
VVGPGAARASRRTVFNRFYLETKANRSGHFIDLTGRPHLEEQREPVVVRGMGSEPDAGE